MQIKELLTDDDAVSPVIGVILMVAITVILAAVIAAFVLGLGDTSDPAPQVSFDYDYNSSGANDLEVTVRSGDTFEAGNAEVTGNGSTTGLDEFGSLSTIVSAGGQFTVSGVSREAQVDITFTPDEGGESNVLSTFTGPDA